MLVRLCNHIINSHRSCSCTFISSNLFLWVSVFYIHICPFYLIFLLHYTEISWIFVHFISSRQGEQLEANRQVAIPETQSAVIDHQADQTGTETNHDCFTDDRRYEEFHFSPFHCRKKRHLLCHWGLNMLLIWVKMPTMGIIDLRDHIDLIMRNIVRNIRNLCLKAENHFCCYLRFVFVLSASRQETWEDSDLFKSQPTSDVDALGKKRYVGKPTAASGWTWGHVNLNCVLKL